jgi:hypothetical protein
MPGDGGLRVQSMLFKNRMAQFTLLQVHYSLILS